MRITDVRWKQRFRNYRRAVALVREPLLREPASLSDLEKAGVLQRFELALELAWKTMQDLLQEEGIQIEPVTPRQVAKHAFSAKVLSDGQIWIEMIDARNLAAHTYEQSVMDTIVVRVRDHFLPAFEELLQYLEKRSQG